MTSTKLVKNEVKRFLTSKEPEVLCVTGAWGVGKTYTWKTILDDVANRAALGLTKYSYVSLFGMNSLMELKLAIAENLQVIETEDLVLDQGVAKAKNALLGSVRYLKGFTSAIPYLGKAISESGDLYFSLVANAQLICIDDLDRRGEKLRVEDVLGLVSFLKEEKRCKLVLLLNEEQLQGKDKEVFDRLFEKVIDTRLVFAPTPAEAVAIAIAGTDELSQRIAQNCERLGISNIRVIKKIERLVREIDAVVSDRSEAVKLQTAHTLTMLGWTKFQPDLAPPFSFYATDSLSRYMEENAELSDEEVRWTAITEAYEFLYLDDYDAVLMDSVKTGIPDFDAIKAKAIEQDEAKTNRDARAAIEAGFRPFHDSFDDNLDEVVTSISEALTQNHRFVGLNELNESVALFKTLGRPDAAQGLLEFFEKHQKSPEFWNPDNDPLYRPVSDPDVRRVSEHVKTTNVREFEPVSEILDAAASMNSATVKVVAERIGADDLYHFIKERRGKAMRAIIHAGLAYRNISNASPDMRAIVGATTMALGRIGAESKLNEIRIKRYGLASESS